ncbi:MAG: sigma-70 family RNA polymerase sigma factor [Bacteroidetes bacterium]|nr:MAG: sigma-70 family RNA polymerase sigma factor [Bacteroidota bacterium]
MSEKELIQACRANDRKAQKALYDRYAPVMLAICRRYVGVLEDAEDVMVEGFFKVFSKIDSYKGEGSFEGWIKRIMVNEALMFLRKNNPLKFSEELNDRMRGVEMPGIESRLTAEQIIALLDELPPGYRTVFNLFVIEGYKHREIADELGISINTSKSQLILAKARMAALVQQRLGISPPTK